MLKFDKKKLAGFIIDGVDMVSAVVESYEEIGAEVKEAFKGAKQDVKETFTETKGEVKETFEEMYARVTAGMSPKDLYPEDLVGDQTQTALAIAIPGRTKADFTVRIVEGVLQVRAKGFDIDDGEDDGTVIVRSNIPKGDYSKDFPLTTKVSNLQVQYVDGVLIIDMSHTTINSEADIG